jgi:hypothetical protein
MSDAEEPNASGIRGLPLGSLCEHSQAIDGVWRSGVRWGDRIVVQTRNSVYTLHALEGGAFHVSGGWFDRESEGSQITTIAGCTWGGRAINERLVAAPGLFLEFGNGVVTTRIQRVDVLRGESPPVAG